MDAPEKEAAVVDRQNLRGHLPHGVQDLVQGEAVRRRLAEATLRDLFQRWAYHEVIPPTVEYDESLAVGAGPDLRQAMYRFFDREGRTLALRADFTPQVARVAASKFIDRPLPLRFFYVGSLFRCEEPQVGRQREFTQAGVELIGANTPVADAEVVALAAAALEELGIREYQINLGQMALFHALTEGFPRDHLESIREATDHKNRVRLLAALDEAGVTGPLHRLLARLPDLIGGVEVLDEALALGGSAAEAAECLAEVYDLLRAYGVADRVILDLGEVRGMDYYTGITFRGVAPGLGWPILSGGRYDELIGQFGPSQAAVGFGMGIERALLVQSPGQGSAPHLSPHLLVQRCPHRACLAQVQRLRREGYRVEVDVLGRDGEALLAYARQRGARHVVRCQSDGGFRLLDAGQPDRQRSADQLVEEMRSWNR
jgi:ATP phosphoribosyltransferase regulatory subunit